MSAADVIAIRRQLKLTQFELAREFGCPIQQVADWESGRRLATEDDLRRLRRLRINQMMTRHNPNHCYRRLDLIEVKPGRCEEFVALCGRVRSVIEAGLGSNFRVYHVASESDAASARYAAEYDIESLETFSSKLESFPREPRQRWMSDWFGSDSSPLRSSSKFLTREIHHLGDPSSEVKTDIRLSTVWSVEANHLEEFLELMSEMALNHVRHGTCSRIYLIEASRPTAKQLEIRTFCHFRDRAALDAFLHDLEHDPEVSSIFARLTSPNSPGVLRSFEIHNEVLLPDDSVFDESCA